MLKVFGRHFRFSTPPRTFNSSLVLVSLVVLVGFFWKIWGWIAGFWSQTTGPGLLQSGLVSRVNGPAWKFVGCLTAVKQKRSRRIWCPGCTSCNRRFHRPDGGILSSESLEVFAVQPRFTVFCFMFPWEFCNHLDLFGRGSHYVAGACHALPTDSRHRLPHSMSTFHRIFPVWMRYHNAHVQFSFAARLRVPKDQYFKSTSAGPLVCGFGWVQ